MNTAKGFKSPEPIDFRVHMITSLRLIGLLSVFALMVFAVVDPIVAVEYSVDFLWVRAGACLIIISFLGLSWFPITARQAMGIAAVLCAITGMVVTILTEMAGGPQSNYWTMLMLLFFGTVSLLPSSTFIIFIILLFNVLFYVFWMSWWDAWGPRSEVVISCAGLLLACVVCLWASSYLNRIRNQSIQYQGQLEFVNTQLQAEIEERQKAEQARNEAEEQFLQAQKLEAIGQFVAGMAHEVNNVLTGVSVGAETAKIHRKDAAVHHRQLDHIHRAVERGKNLTRDLLSFARKSPRVFEAISLTKQVKQVVDMLQRTHRGRVQIETDIAEDDFCIYGDASLIFQMILNICLNGIDAMSGSGLLIIRLQKKSDQKSPLENGQSTLRLEIIDQGCGMTTEEKKHIFEPFFTTKPIGQGTGLGLAMAYGVIVEHGGHVEVESNVAVGSVFRILLPILDAVPEEKEQTVNYHQPPATGKILVVDDDELVRTLTAELLREAGYEVFTAEGGEEGLQIYANEDSFSVVIIDMIMPNIGGDAVFKRIREINSEQPVIFISGYTDDQVVSSLEEASGWRFLQKPFVAQRLFAMVAEMCFEGRNEKIASG